MSRSLGTGIRFDQYGHASGPRVTHNPQENNGRRRKGRPQKDGAEGPMMLEKKLPARTDTPKNLSFFNGIPTSRNVKPRFQYGVSGVPTSLKTGVGYWYPFHKESREGVPLTVWYYYEQGDGPHSAARYGNGNPLRDGTFWVKRPGVDPKHKDNIVDYQPDMVRLRGLKPGINWISDLPRPQRNQPRGGYQSDRSGYNSDRGGYSSGGYNHGYDGSGYTTPHSGASTPGSYYGGFVRQNVQYAAAAGSRPDSYPGSREMSRPGSPQAAVYVNSADGLEPRHVKRRRQKKKEKTNQSDDGTSADEEPVSTYKKNLSGGRRPEEVFKQKCLGGCECTGDDSAWALTRDLVPSQHYIRSNGKIDLVSLQGSPDDSGVATVQLVVKYDIPGEFLPNFVRYLGHVGEQVPAVLSGLDKYHVTCNVDEDFPPLVSTDAEQVKDWSSAPPPPDNGWTVVQKKVKFVDQQTPSQPDMLKLFASMSQDQKEAFLKSAGVKEPAVTVTIDTSNSFAALAEVTGSAANPIDNPESVVPDWEKGGKPHDEPPAVSSGPTFSKVDVVVSKEQRTPRSSSKNRKGQKKEETAGWSSNTPATATVSVKLTDVTTEQKL